MKKWFAIGGLLLVTMIWGGGFVASDMALESMLPFQIMTVRFFIAVVFIGAVSARSLKNIRWETIRAGVIMGISLFAGFAFQIIGLQYTTPSKNAFLTALNVVMVPFIAFVVLKKKIGFMGYMGAVMSVAGVFLLSFEGNLSLNFGDGLTLLCAVGFAFQIFFTGEFVKKYKTSQLNFVQMATAFLLSAICMILSGQTDIHITTQGTGSVLYLGFVSTSLCYLLQTSCQRYVDETKAAIILSMESVFGTLFSVIILQEVITPRMIAGCLVILTAVIISNLSVKSEPRGEKIKQR
ncbi:DMT family transporter [Blautia liquoris]|uniref:DMT family transporter n=1 Tax=Blautia liquoris TaxID=2779518 RepID=A0A7M2RE71_9FIRM|nr:DMT family transporter [Blautia liquoris]QOV18596.1 DMT family transporter [Blautia liquoris]